MRQRRSGTVFWLGSLGGWRTGAGFGLYAATKHAVRALGGALDDEVRALGMRSIVVELGYFRTSFLAEDNRAPHRARIADYAPLIEAADAGLRAYAGRQPGDPVRAAEVMVDIAHDEGVAADREIPQVIGLGADYNQAVKGAAEGTLKRIAQWWDIARSTDLPKDA
jgi:NAD(P)-dependent dehydrogenase (short-subunit alcohol dehydrogenase family)